MAAEGGNIVRFTYTGADGEDIPREATHITIAVKIVHSEVFKGHPNIVEVICHDIVIWISQYAFEDCPSLRRVIMPGVKILDWGAFYGCEALTDVECGKLEMIGQLAFCNCARLRSINLLSTRVVEKRAFEFCETLFNVKFSNKLERIDGSAAFFGCTSLERITLPLKNEIITEDDIFQACANLNHVDLVEEELLNETVAALHLGEWRNDMNEEIDSINQILPNAPAGRWGDDDEVYDEEHYGENAQAIRRWITSVRSKLIHYQAEHQRLLDEAETTLQLLLPRDILMNNVLRFLELPPYAVGLGDQANEDDEALWDEDDEEDSQDEEGGDSMSWEEDDEEEDY